MRLQHIKNLLQISCNFNTSAISHSFSIDGDNLVTVKCIENTFLLEVSSNTDQQLQYYTSIDEAAEALYNKIHGSRPIE